ncbi:hypothetical protein [Aquihabitans sp. McL0605]|uniref:hypothetical protein n=1 Tax=Aquihabitans sp. McL0605 TaxID=3415671 RepID=UPI003CE68FB4
MASEKRPRLTHPMLSATARSTRTRGSATGPTVATISSASSARPLLASSSARWARTVMAATGSSSRGSASLRAGAAIEVARPEPGVGQAAGQQRPARLRQRGVVPDGRHDLLELLGVAVEDRRLDRDERGVVAAPALAGGAGEAPGQVGVATEHSQAASVDQEVRLDRAPRLQAPARQLREVVAAARPALLVQVGERALQLAGAQHRQLLAEDLAVDRVRQPDAGAPPVGGDAEQPAPVQRHGHIEPGQRLHVDQPDGPGHRQGLERLQLGPIELGEVGADQLVEPRRPGQAVQAPHPALADQGGLLLRAQHELAQHLQVPARHLGEPADRIGVDRAVEHPVEQGADLIDRQLRDGLDRQVALLEQGHDEVGQRRPGPDGGHEEDPPLDRERQQQRERRGIEVVEVVHQQQEALPVGAVGQVGAGPVEQGRPIVLARAHVVAEVRRQQVGERTERDLLGGRVPHPAPSAGRPRPAAAPRRAGSCPRPRPR